MRRMWVVIHSERRDPTITPRPSPRHWHRSCRFTTLDASVANWSTTSKLELSSPTGAQVTTTESETDGELGMGLSWLMAGAVSAVKVVAGNPPTAPGMRNVTVVPGVRLTNDV